MNTNHSINKHSLLYGIAVLYYLLSYSLVIATSLLHVSAMYICLPIELCKCFIHSFVLILVHSLYVYMLCVNCLVWPGEINVTILV